MAAKRKTKKPQWVAILWTSTGQYLSIRNSPSDEAVRNFVRIQRHRFHNHIATGPSGGRAHYIESVDVWADEAEFERGEGTVLRSIDIEDIPSNPELPTSN